MNSFVSKGVANVLKFTISLSMVCSFGFALLFMQNIKPVPCYSLSVLCIVCVVTASVRRWRLSNVIVGAFVYYLASIYLISEVLFVRSFGGTGGAQMLILTALIPAAYGASSWSFKLFPQYRAWQVMGVLFAIGALLNGLGILK